MVFRNYYGDILYGEPLPYCTEFALNYFIILSFGIILFTIFLFEKCKDCIIYLLCIDVFLMIFFVFMMLWPLLFITARLSKKAKESAIEKLKMAAVLQFTLPGVPCVYYGDENGQEGHSDPFCRQCFDWNTLNDDLISFYQALGNVRKEYKTIFKDGIFQELKLQDGLLYFKRENEKGDCVYVYVNNSSKRYTIELPKPVRELLQNKTYEKTMAVLPYSYAVFVEE